MVAEKQIHLEAIYKKEPTDLSLCSLCNEQIFSHIFRLHIVSDNCNVEGRTNFILCESCNSLINNTPKC